MTIEMSAETQSIETCEEVCPIRHIIYIIIVARSPLSPRMCDLYTHTQRWWAPPGQVRQQHRIGPVLVLSWWHICLPIRFRLGPQNLGRQHELDPHNDQTFQEDMVFHDDVIPRCCWVPYCGWGLQYDSIPRYELIPWCGDMVPQDLQRKYHYNDVIMSAIAFQITSLTIVFSTIYSDADQRTHLSSASLAFVRGIHRGMVNSSHKGPVTRKMFPFDVVIMADIICDIILSNFHTIYVGRHGNLRWQVR